MRQRLLGRIAVVAFVAGLSLSSSTGTASADPVSNLLQGGAPQAVHVVKDLGGGAYWNVTTSSLYAVAAGSELVVTAATSVADLLATTAANGRDLLLLINGAVLVPVTQKL